MGMETLYKLTVEADDSVYVEVIQKAIESFGYKFPSFIAKWYIHEEAMKELSLDFPDVVLNLEGMDDIDFRYWSKKFKNGELLN